MIVSDSHKWVFCHIPKNGGTSLRRHFLNAWSDAREYQGRHPVAALDGRTRDLTHITVTEAGRLFDDDLIGRGYDVTAVLRSPMPRLSSALLQYIKSFAAEERHFVDAKTVSGLLQVISIQSLCETAQEDYRHIYFRRQSDFIDGVPKAHLDLVLMEQLSTRFPNLSRENRGGALPSWLRMAVRQPAVRRLAGRLGPKTKSQLSRMLVLKDRHVNEAIAEAVTAESAFLEDFYGKDQALYDRLCELRASA